ncbi:MAG: hypothetical protein ABR936_03480 [Bacteroidota bacterium]|jgi:hypothetical protein
MSHYQESSTSVTSNKNYFTTVFLIFVFMVCSFSQAEAQVVPDTNKTVAINIDNSGKFFAAASFIVGGGLKNIKVGTATNNSDVTISGGGGIGGNLALGYGISSSLEVSLAGGTQSSTLSPKVDNAEGSFNRTIFLATLKDKIPITSTGIIKVGAGLGYYIPSDLDLDFTKISGGGHNVFSYDSKIGFHLTCDYEMFTASKFSWGFGLKYYNVTYNLKSVKSNGTIVSINSMSSDLKNETMELDGSGIDLSVFIAICL